MTDAPKRIWINKVHGQHPEDWEFTDGKCWTKAQLRKKVEYVRADRIEELVKEKGYALERIMELDDRTEALTAKLAKAVEALQYANRMVRLDLLHMTNWDHKDFSQAVVDTGKRITTVLAELEGK